MFCGNMSVLINEEIQYIYLQQFVSKKNLQTAVHGIWKLVALEESILANLL